jgi:hypothetical protein
MNFSKKNQEHKNINKFFMSKSIKILLIILITVFYSSTLFSQNSMESDKSVEDKTMKTYVIEREIPKAGEFTTEELVTIAKTSCGVLDEMGPKIEWLHSYVTEDKIYCIYRAQSKEIIREHAAKGKFPANSISELSTIISPETAKL